MPELDGYQTCTLIRNAEDTRNTPVVMLSSSDGILILPRAGARRYGARHQNSPERVLRQLIHKRTQQAQGGLIDVKPGAPGSRNAGAGLRRQRRAIARAGERPVCWVGTSLGIAGASLLVGEGKSTRSLKHPP